jgi:hypothetical protein
MQIRYLAMGLLLVTSMPPIMSMEATDQEQTIGFLQSSWQYLIKQKNRIITFFKNSWNSSWLRLQALKVYRKKTSAAQSDGTIPPSVPIITVQPSEPASQTKPAVAPQQPIAQVPQKPIILENLITAKMSDVIIFKNDTQFTVAFTDYEPSRLIIKAGEEKWRWKDTISDGGGFEVLVGDPQEFKLKQSISLFKHDNTAYRIHMFRIVPTGMPDIQPSSALTNNQFDQRVLDQYLSLLQVFIVKATLEFSDFRYDRISELLKNLSKHIGSFKSGGEKVRIFLEEYHIPEQLQQLVSLCADRPQRVQLLARIVAKIKCVWAYMALQTKTVPTATPPSITPVKTVVPVYPEYDAIWKEVTIPESYKKMVVDYAHKEGGTGEVPTLDMAMKDRDAARLLVWGAVIAHEVTGLVLVADPLSKSSVWCENKDESHPVFKGTRELIGDNFGESVTFKHFNASYSNQSKQKDIMRKLIADYKIHLMPVGDLTQTLAKLFHLIDNTPQLQTDIWRIKFNKKYDDNQLIKAGSSTAEARPKIVIYPASGKQAAQRVFDTIYAQFKNDPGLGIAPRFNQQVTDLIYIAQGNGDDKAGDNNKEYFQAPDYVYFDAKKVAQEFEVDPASLDFTLTVPN